MKIKALLTLILAAVFVPSIYATPEKYVFDNAHTSVTFHINHFGYSNPSGKWMANGTMVLDEQTPQNSKVDININVADIMTGVPKLDEHLKGKDFFDVKKYPTATFVSQKVEITGKDTAKVYGILTLHGVSKPTVLSARLNKLDMSPMNSKKTAGFTASTTLKRSDFGITAYLPNLSDDVKIDIEAEAYKAD